MTELKLRIATLDDYDEICRLFKQLDDYHVKVLPEVFKTCEGPARPLAVVTVYITNPNADYILAEQDGAVVGLMNIKKEVRPNVPIFTQGEFAEIENIVVDKNHRTQGIGTALFEEAKKWAQERGLKSIQLVSWAANTLSTEFYINKGFKPLLSKMELKLE